MALQRKLKVQGLSHVFSATIYPWTAMEAKQAEKLFLEADSPAAEAAEEAGEFLSLRRQKERLVLCGNSSSSTG